MKYQKEIINKKFEDTIKNGLEIPNMLSSVSLDDNVSVTIKDKKLCISGVFGRSYLDAKKLDKLGNLLFKRDKMQLHLYSTNYVGKSSKNTITSLLKKRIEGVTRGFFKTLEISGIGYKVSLSKGIRTKGVYESSFLILRLGFSHEIQFNLPNDIIAFCGKSNTITLFGTNFQQLTQICAQIKNIRTLDPYKGKGIRYTGDLIKLKVGKRK